MGNFLGTVRDAAISWAPQINLVAVFLILLFGIGLWFFRPGQLSQVPAKRTALEFWILHWIPPLWIYWLLLYGGATIFTGAASSLDLLIISLNDLQSIFLLAFSYAMIRGEELNRSSIRMGILLGMVGFLSYNIVIWSISADPVPQEGSVWRYLWCMPSAITSSIAWLSLGFVFLLRCGWVTSFLFISTVIYIMAQMPIYLSAVIDVESDIRWYVMVGLLKPIIASFFYVFFTAPFKDYKPLNLFPRDRGVENYIYGKVKGGAGVAQALLIAFLATLIVSFFDF